MQPEWMLVLIPLLPLLGGLIGLALKRQPRLAASAGLLSLLASTGLAAVFLKAGGAFWGMPWLAIPELNFARLGEGQTVTQIPLAFNAGVPQLLFILTTALIACCVLVFALRERRGDPRAAQFHGLITLFAGSMLLFLTADTLLVMYLAWELMGVLSYFLIAHTRTKEALRAARQAFWTTRATDFGLLFAIIIMMSRFGWATLSSIDVSVMLNSMISAGANPNAAKSLLGWVVVLIILAVIGKAAQWPLSFWLADAMVAPTPVSALLHAATMVAAGPFLLVRLPIELFLTHERVAIWATIAGGTALLTGGLMALTAKEPKRVLAYSTVSQLGLVILAVGVFSPEAGYYHLISHAWFKAALFLGVGLLAAVWCAQQKDHINAPSLKDLAGLAGRFPLLKWGVLILAGVSLAGVPLLAGSLGKEQVLFALLFRPGEELAAGVSFQTYFPGAIVAWRVGAVLLLISIPITAAYITRLVAILCWPMRKQGELPASDPMPVGDDDPRVALQIGGGWTLPLMLTAGMALIGSVGMSLLWFMWYETPAGFKLPTGLAWGEWDSHAFIAAFALSAFGVLVGIWLAAAYVHGGQAARNRVQGWPLVASLSSLFAHGMYLREFFTIVVGRTGELLAMLAGRADINIIDWLVMNTGRFGRGLSHVAAWVDDVIVDSLRRAACGFWWGIKHLHSRWMQTGKIQHYMLIVLIAAVVLCFAIIKPLGDICGRMLSNLYAGGDRWSN